MLKCKKKISAMKFSNNSNTKKCISFVVDVNQSAHDVIQDIDLPAGGSYYIDVYDTTNPTYFICTWYNRTKNPKMYFGNTDVGHNNQARWRIIQGEMLANKIKQITIKLCPKIL